MKYMRYTDENGWLKQSYIKDKMSNRHAHKGIPHNPPDLNQIDWDAVKRELNNLLVERSLITLKDLQGADVLSGTILSIIKPKIITLYKDKDNIPKETKEI